MTDYENPLEGSDFPDSIHWVWQWSVDFDWSTWLETFIRKEVLPMAWTSEDWMKNAFAPLIAAAVPALVAAIPQIIQAILEAFKTLPAEKQGAIVAAAADKFLLNRQA